MAVQRHERGNLVSVRGSSHEVSVEDFFFKSVEDSSFFLVL